MIHGASKFRESIRQQEEQDWYVMICRELVANSVCTGYYFSDMRLAIVISNSLFIHAFYISNFFVSYFNVYKNSH